MEFSKEIREFIEQNGPCEAAILWVRRRKFRTLSQVWKACARPWWLDWMWSYSPPYRKKGAAANTRRLSEVMGTAELGENFGENVFSPKVCRQIREIFPDPFKKTKKKR